MIPGAPKRSKKTWVCDSPSNRIEPTAEGHEGDVGPGPARFEQAAAEGAPADPARPRRRGANGASRPSSRNQTVNVSPCERHSSRPNWAIIARVKAV